VKPEVAELLSEAVRLDPGNATALKFLDLALDRARRGR
jgi:hypothetical protein